jgi:hypothetical protein
MHKLQAALPSWVDKNGPTKVKANIEQLQQAIKEQHYSEADKLAETILKTMGE